MNIYIYTYAYHYTWLCEGSGTQITSSGRIPGPGASFFEYGWLFIHIIKNGDPWMIHLSSFCVVEVRRR